MEQVTFESVAAAIFAARIIFHAARMTVREAAGKTLITADVIGVTVFIAKTIFA